jgi:cytochrome d ubiquinol oxidase subunit I
MTPLNNQYNSTYGKGYYIPDVFIQYWGMRVMAYLGGLVFLLALWGLWLLWRKRLETSRLFLWLATWAVITPFLMNTAGWLLTESGRQPWIVQGIMLTKNGISPSVSFTELVISLVIFVLLYICLALLDLVFMLRYSRRGLDPDPSTTAAAGDQAARVPSMLY